MAAFPKGSPASSGRAVSVLILKCSDWEARIILGELGSKIIFAGKMSPYSVAAAKNFSVERNVPSRKLFLAGQDALLYLCDQMVLLHSLPSCFS